MIPATLQFIAMIAHALNDRMARRVDYLQEEVRVLKEALRIRRADRARADVTSALHEMIGELAPLRRAPGCGSLFRSPVARRNEVLAFADMVIADAKGRFAP